LLGTWSILKFWGEEHPVLILQHMIKLAISDFPTQTFLQLQQTTSQIPESLLYIITLVKLVNTPQHLQ
jgi:hypothetical protein